jgi:DNA processing protein
MSPTACDQCLRRAWLVGSLSAAIERSLEGRPAGRARELLALEDEPLAAAVGGGEDLVEASRAREASVMRSALEGADAWACCRHDAAFPTSVQRLADAPRVLFGRGDPERLAMLASDDCVTVVGARRPSAYGREMGELLGRELGSAGLVVISGMALGIDSCAHRGALQANALTVAVLGSGADVPHPARMSDLYRRIADRGLVLSELPPGTTPRRWTFPARNRIMAALGAMTVVVEGRERSGSLITANLAAEGGREVGAVPGRVGAATAAGPNALLHQGAHVVRGGEDVLDVLWGIGAQPPAEVQDISPVDVPPALAAVLAEVENGEATLDAVACGAGLDPMEAAEALSMLEVAGLVSCDSAGWWRRTTMRAA